MPNDGTGTGWDEVDPEGIDVLRVGAREIRDLRIGTRIRWAKEHELFDDGSVGGNHRQGAARAFHDGTEPATAPNGDAIGASDSGRIWVDSDTEAHLHYTGSAFVHKSFMFQTGTILVPSTASGFSDFVDITNDYPFQMLAFMWESGNAFPQGGNFVIPVTRNADESSLLRVGVVRDQGSKIRYDIDVDQSGSNFRFRLQVFTVGSGHTLRYRVFG
jgi:hypothetical protein